MFPRIAESFDLVKAAAPMMPMAAFSDFICAAIYSKGAALGKVIISCGPERAGKYRDTRNVGMIGIAIFNRREDALSERSAKGRSACRHFPFRTASLIPP